jgi:ComF family protein
MKRLMEWISRLQSGLTNVVFPNVCLACGERVLKEGQHICSFCLNKRFAIALSKDKMSSAGIILPRDVKNQQALWEFDRGGILQQLIHHLKYQQLMDVGIQLGTVFARKIKGRTKVQSILDTSETVMLPVPLHYLKFRRRGFNQAFTIAQGMQSILSIPICSIKAVVRRTNTPSQTGLSLEERQENMRDVFKIRRGHEISEKSVIIVDDVFTTGSTSFELAKTVAKAGASSVMIWTIAQA